MKGMATGPIFRTLNHKACAVAHRKTTPSTHDLTTTMPQRFGHAQSPGPPAASRSWGTKYTRTYYSILR